ncbi:MAG: tetratricopeptide repeat protein [Sandaracinaceae bacterium]|nr:tetratricopeptide repeat protein [Sandaracinaceae bacterium]
MRAAISPDDFAALARPALSGASGEAADDLLAALHLLYRAHPDAELLFFVLCVAIRKRGEVGQARVMAEARVRSHPSARADIALAGVRRAAGELEAAIALYERAAARSTEHAGALLDAGDLWTQLGDLAKALDAYERALAIRGDDEWARSSAEYLRVLRDDDRAARASLLARASAPGASARAVELATRVAPFEVAIPPRPEGSVSAVRDALAREAVRVELRLSSLEAPSALLAARRALRGRELRVTVNDVPSPDPRDPIGEVDFVLWKYPSSGALGWLTGARAFEAKPGVPPPRPSSAEAIAALAERPYERERWCRDAEAIARSIGPDAIREACAAMVHPLEARAGHAEWDWIFPRPGRRRARRRARRRRVAGPAVGGPLLDRAGPRRLGRDRRARGGDRDRPPRAARLHRRLWLPRRDAEVAPDESHRAGVHRSPGRRPRAASAGPARAHAALPPAAAQDRARPRVARRLEPRADRSTSTAGAALSTSRAAMW